MVKQIRKHIIMKHLAHRLDLRHKELQDLELDEKVVPQISIDYLLRNWDCRGWANITQAAATGTGLSETDVEVSEGRRYNIRGIRINRTGGDGTITHAYVMNNERTRYCALKVQTAAASMDILPADIPYPLIMDEDMKLGLEIAAISSNSTWAVWWYGSVEDIKRLD